jgi:uncharacterized protein YndB with AHSA1/START domain
MRNRLVACLPAWYRLATMRLQDECGAVRRERVLRTDRGTAWELLADPRELEGWLADEVDLEAVEEGAQGTLRWDDGTRRRVVVEEVAPGRRVALRWEAVGPGAGEPDTLVELTLDDHEEGTLLRVVEVPLAVLHAHGAELPVAARGGGPVLLAA